MNIYDKIRNYPKVLVEKIWVRLRAQTRIKDFTEKVTNSFFRQVELGMKNVIGKEMFGIVRKKFYVPKGLGN